MKGLKKKAIIACTHIMVQWWHFVTPQSEDMFDLGEEVALRGINYHKVWYKPSDSTELIATDHLKAYLETSLQERKISHPFFNCPPSLNDELPGVDSLKLMNRMLQSDKENWPIYILEIFKTKPTKKIKNFWGFISEISNYMPTPVLQKTFFLVVKEQDILLQGNNAQIFINKVKEIFQILVSKYSEKMKEHVDFLKKEERPKEVIDIFTRMEQENLGEYGIHLEKEWYLNEQIELYKNWASHIHVYLKVQGSLKGILETQAIMVSIIKLCERVALGMPPIEAIGPPEIQYEIGQCFEHWMDKQRQDLTQELVDYIQSADEKSLWEFGLRQLGLSYGIRCGWACLFEDVKKIELFWARYMPFYFNMMSHAETSTWEHIHVMDKLILNNTKDLNLFMQEFLTYKNSVIVTPQSNLVTRFLNFVLDYTKSKSLRKGARWGLEFIGAPRQKNSSKITRIV